MRILSNKYNKLLLILVALTMMAADIAPIAAAELSKADIAAYRAAFAAAKSENWRKVKSRSAATHEKLPGKSNELAPLQVDYVESGLRRTLRFHSRQS